MSEETTEQQVTEAPKAKKENFNVFIRGGAIQTNVEALRKKDVPDFSVGDTVKVHYNIKEGDKERIQTYEGTVASIRGEGPGKTFLVRRISHDIGVERIFPYASPSVAKIEVVRKGRVRRAKLFYLRHKSGKAGRIKEQFQEQVGTAGGSSPKAKAGKKKAKEEKSA